MRYPCLLCENEVDSLESICDNCKDENGNLLCPECAEIKKSLTSLKKHFYPAHNSKIPNLVCKNCGVKEHRKNHKAKYCSDCVEKKVYNKGREKNKAKSSCRNCGETFEYFKYEAEGKYCSPECFHEDRIERVETKCDNCGSNIRITPNSYKRSEHNFCDKKCKDKWSRTKEAKDIIIPNHPKAKGELAEGAAIGELSKLNVVILEPRGDNQRYDFVIEINEVFYRLQCKHGRIRNEKIVFGTSSTNSATASWDERKDYVGDVEFFIVYVSELDKTHLIPIEDATSSQMKLDVTCEEYKLSDRIQSLRENGYE